MNAASGAVRCPPAEKLQAIIIKLKQEIMYFIKTFPYVSTNSNGNNTLIYIWHTHPSTYMYID